MAALPPVPPPTFLQQPVKEEFEKGFESYIQNLDTFTLVKADPDLGYYYLTSSIDERRGFTLKVVRNQSSILADEKSSFERSKELFKKGSCYIVRAYGFFTFGEYSAYTCFVYALYRPFDLFLQQCAADSTSHGLTRLLRDYLGCFHFLAGKGHHRRIRSSRFCGLVICNGRGLVGDLGVDSNYSDRKSDYTSLAVVIDNWLKGMELAGSSIGNPSLIRDLGYFVKQLDQEEHIRLNFAGYPLFMSSLERIEFYWGAFEIVETQIALEKAAAKKERQFRYGYDYTTPYDKAIVAALKVIGTVPHGSLTSFPDSFNWGNAMNVHVIFQRIWGGRHTNYKMDPSKTLDFLTFCRHTYFHLRERSFANRDFSTLYDFMDQMWPGYLFAAYSMLAVKNLQI